MKSYDVVIAALSVNIHSKLYHLKHCFQMHYKKKSSNQIRRLLLYRV